MAAIPARTSADPTLEALDAHLEEKETKERQRPYMGASGIGKACERDVWLTFHWASKRVIKILGILAIQDGFAGEDLMAKRLRQLPGIELWTTQNDGSQRQIGFEDLGGHFRGNIDGVIRGLYQAPETPHIWENKVVNEKKWDKLVKLKSELGEKNALKEWDPVYHAQAQLYMHYLDLPRHYLTCCKPGNRGHTSVRTDYDAVEANRLIAKAERLIFAARPPSRISDNPAWFECKWCDHYANCHGKAAPERNCRTCAHSTASPAGGWVCERPGHERPLDEPLQRIGCDAYHKHPDL